jgi:hypothetical protein
MELTRGIHGRTKVSPEPAMPYHTTPCRQAPLKRPHGCFRVAAQCGNPQGWRPAAVPLFPRIPYAVCLCPPGVSLDRARTAESLPLGRQGGEAGECHGQADRKTLNTP